MSEPPAPSQKAPWRNPFILAFVVGAVVLTALPFLQRPLLRAPPPLRTLPAWTLNAPDGRRVGSEELTGQVWLVSVVAEPCGPSCLERQEAFVGMARHLEDLQQPVALVTIVVPSGGDGGRVDALSQLAPDARWHVVSGAPASVEPLVVDLGAAFAAWSGLDAGRTAASFAAVPAFGLVDQNGAVRGFWPDDATGRGNLINAARMLARYGPDP